MTETRLPRDRCNVVFGVTSLMNSYRTRDEDGSKPATRMHAAVTQRHCVCIIFSKISLFCCEGFVTPSLRSRAPTGNHFCRPIVFLIINEAS